MDTTIFWHVWQAIACLYPCLVPPWQLFPDLASVSRWFAYVGRLGLTFHISSLPTDSWKLVDICICSLIRTYPHIPSSQSSPKSSGLPVSLWDLSFPCGWQAFACFHLPLSYSSAVELCGLRVKHGKLQTVQERWYKMYGPVLYTPEAQYFPESIFLGGFFGRLQQIPKHNLHKTEWLIEEDPREICYEFDTSSLYKIHFYTFLKPCPTFPQKHFPMGTFFGGM